MQINQQIICKYKKRKKSIFYLIQKCLIKWFNSVLLKKQNKNLRYLKKTNRKLFYKIYTKLKNYIQKVTEQ